MGQKYSLKDNGSFVIKDYNQARPFSNFLPGISGKWGIPLWVFYVNRGQGIISFGLKDKNSAIAEFFPANKAYSFVSSLGFRTFIKIDKKEYFEPFKTFSHYKKKEQMQIKSASFEIKESNLRDRIDTKVKYFTLPNTPIAGLVRAVTIKNTSNKNINLEVLDGLPRIIPFGAANPFLKDMSRTLEAWMHSFIYDNLAIFRLIVDPRDTSQTKYIEGANFNYTFLEANGKRLSSPMIVDPNAIFGQDTSYSVAAEFLNKNFKVPLNQMTVGKTPCSFSYFKLSLKKDEEKTFYSVFGAAFKTERIKKFTKSMDADFLKNKECENKKIIEEIKNNALCISNSGSLNHYIKNTYLDNVLRGGYPWSVKNKE